MSLWGQDLTSSSTEAVQLVDEAIHDVCYHWGFGDLAGYEPPELV